MGRAISIKTGKRVLEPDERSETQQILKALGCVILQPKALPKDAECSICLEKIKPGTQFFFGVWPYLPREMLSNVG